MLNEYEIQRKLKRQTSKPKVKSTTDPDKIIDAALDQCIEKLQEKMTTGDKLSAEAIASIKEKGRMQLLEIYKNELVRIESEKSNGNTNTSSII